jgi:hypothetical protein
MAQHQHSDKTLSRSDDSDQHSESEGDNSMKDSLEKSVSKLSGQFAEHQRHSSSPPSDEQGSQMIRAYIARLHYRYPYLDIPDLWRLHEDRIRLTNRMASELSAEGYFSIFKLFMIYATGTKLLCLTGKRIHPTAEVCDSCFASA